MAICGDAAAARDLKGACCKRRLCTHGVMSVYTWSCHCHGSRHWSDWNRDIKAVSERCAAIGHPNGAVTRRLTARRTDEKLVNRSPPPSQANSQNSAVNYVYDTAAAMALVVASAFMSPVSVSYWLGY